MTKLVMIVRWEETPPRDLLIKGVFVYDNFILKFMVFLQAFQNIYAKYVNFSLNPFYSLSLPFGDRENELISNEIDLIKL